MICTGCLFVLDAYTITLSGTTNNGCTDCANVNGTFTLVRTADCVWTGPAITICGVSRNLTMTGGIGGTSIGFPGFMTIWTTSAGCATVGNVLTRISFSDCNWQFSVTLS